MRNPELWHRLQSTPITLSDGADLGVLIADRFDIRPAMVADLMTDYRRFLYLAAISDGLLVPSRAVDQVWALHMADQPAWADFSRRMFGEVLDGIPARARPARNPAYRQTLNLLEAEFGITPKPPIWPGERNFAARAGQSAVVERNVNNLWLAGYVGSRSIWLNSHGRGNHPKAGQAGKCPLNLFEFLHP